MSQFETEGNSWLFLTSHAHVLLEIARSPDSSARSIAAAVGITPRQTQRVIADLDSAGYIDKQRCGRTNHYTVHPDARLRHPQLAEHAIGGVLEALGAAPARPGSRR